MARRNASLPRVPLRLPRVERVPLAQLPRERPLLQAKVPNNQLQRGLRLARRLVVRPLLLSPRISAQSPRVPSPRASAPLQKRNVSFTYSDHHLFLAKSDKKKKAEKEDDFGKPTRTISAYIFYSNETIPKLKAEKGIAHKDAMSEAGKIWNTMTEEQKKPFEEKNKADAARYEK